ncbi:MAG TPA: hypothetical protein VFJ65_07920 [Solirubrobacterales bacterium]|nr:hypothetical protein [Solirubrobacterales bacterium]
MLEMQVIAALKEAFKSREAWEAKYPDLSPLDDDRVLLQNWASTAQTHGMVLAHLAASPQTRTELMAEMEGMIDRAPAWLDAHFEGQQVMTLELFLHGIAQTQAKQRAAIERVVAEQVDDPAAIEKMLAQAPIPEGTEERSALIHSVGAVMTAHSEALVELAYDLDTRASRRFD